MLVGLGLRELHLVHALAGVPVEEGLAAEHGGELLGHALEHVLDGGGVTCEGQIILDKLLRIKLVPNGFEPICSQNS